MATVGLSFGSATSGAGFDVTSTVSSIMSIMREPETAWATQLSSLQAQDTVLSTLGTDLSSLSSALSSLTSFDGSLSQKNGASSDSSLVALTGATSTAQAGSHSLTVQQLATNDQMHSSLISTGATLNGIVTVQLGSGTAQTISLNSSNNTVQGLATALNNLNMGVTATVISGSSGSYLSLTSTSSGAANEISFDTSGLTDSNGNGVAMTETQAAKDAQYTVDGVSLTSSSNTVSSALPGITFQLLGAASSPVTLQIVNDTSTISTALQTFVTAYNTLSSALRGQEGKDASGNAQPLFGDPTLSQMQSQLAAAFSFATSNSGSTSNLAALGLSLGTDGTLSLDTTKLNGELQTNFTGVQNFFENAGDFGQNLTTVLNNLGTTGYGVLAMRTNQNSAQETELANNKSALEDRLSGYESSLTTELNTANQILQGIPSRLDEVNQIYSAITGYNKN